MKLTPAKIDEILHRVEKEAKNYPIPSALMAKVSDGTKYGNETKYNFNGWFGYYYQTLALLVKYFKPEHILELGNQLGTSTAMMYYEMQPDARMVSMDIARDQRFIPDEIIKDPRVSFHIGDDLDLQTYGSNIPVDVDFLFTDTVHFYKHLKNEFFIYQHLLADNAIIVIDDVLLNDKGKFFEESPYFKRDIGNFAHHSGLGILLYTRPTNAPKEHSARIAQAALASARIWHEEAENLANRRIYMNVLGIKADIKEKLAQHPRLEKGVYRTIHRARSLRRRASSLIKSVIRTP
jgi:predicted O-methyltransferase YrrM